MKLRIIFFFAISMPMTACQKPADTNQMVPFTVSMSALVGSTLPASQKAEEMAKAAELLLTADGMIEANSMAKAALKIDPNNLRAGFIVALLSPIMVAKGFYGRTKNFVDQHPKSFKASGTREEFEAKTQPSIVRFLEDAPADLNSEAEIQDVIDQVRDALEKLRLFVHSHKEKELTLKENAILFLICPAVMLKPVRSPHWRAVNMNSNARTQRFATKSHSIAPTLKALK